jgi:hypothetical protein
MKFLVAGLLLLSCAFSSYVGETYGRENTMMNEEITEEQQMAAMMQMSYIMDLIMAVIMDMGEVIQIEEVREEDLVNMGINLEEWERCVNEDVSGEEGGVEQINQGDTTMTIDEIEKAVNENTSTLDAWAKFKALEVEIKELQEKIMEEVNSRTENNEETSIGEDMERLDELERQKDDLMQELMYL